MTSEIRANTLKNRVGLGTVSYTNTGIVVSGIVTANSFSGTGDLDVDGHTNLDNVSIAGVTTTTGSVNVGDDLDVNDDLTIGGEFNMLGSSDTAKYFDVRTGASNSLHIRSSLGGASNLVTMLSIGRNGSSFVGNLTLGDSSDSSSAAGPEFTLNRNSASPANADYLGQIKFAGRSSTGIQRNYAKITGKILDVTNGAEDGILEFAHIKAGSQTITGRWRSDKLQLLNSTNLTVDGNIGIGTDNAVVPLHVQSKPGGNGIIAIFGDSGTDNATFERLAIRNNVTAYPAITNDSSNDTFDLRSMGHVQVTIDSNNNSVGKYFRVTTNGEGGAGTEIFRVGDDGRVSINDNSRPASDVNEGAQLRVTGAPLIRNQYYSPHGHYFGSIGYTDNTNTKAWLAVDSAYAQSSAVSAGIFLSAFHQDAGGSSCGFTIKNLKDGNPLVFSSVTTAASTNNPAVETERLRIKADGSVGINTTGNFSNIALSIYGADVGEGTAKGQLILKDNAAYDASPTAGIIFQGIHAAGSQAIFAGIRGFKENTSNGNYAGALAFDVRAHGAVAYEALRITSAGVIQTKTRSAEVRRMILSGSPTNSAFNIEAHDGETGSSAGDVQGKLGLFYNDGTTLTNTSCISFIRGSGAADGAMAFVTNQTERVRIESDGQVVINRSSGAVLADSSTKLEVFNSTENLIFVSNSTAAASQDAGIIFAPANNVYGGKIIVTSDEDFSSSANRTAHMGFYTRKDGTAAERLRINSNGVVHINSVAGGQAVVAFGNPTGNSFQEQNRIGGDTIFVADENISSAISMPRQGCFVIITAFSDTAGNYPQPNTSCMAYVDMGPSRNVRICDLGTGVGTAVVGKNAYTSNVSDCDNNKLTIMAGNTQGTFHLVNREANSDYYYQITFL